MIETKKIISGGISVIIEIKSCNNFQQFIYTKIPENLSQFWRRISAENSFAYWVPSFDCIKFSFVWYKYFEQTTDAVERGYKESAKYLLQMLLIFKIILQTQNYKRKKLYPFCVCVILVLFLNVSFFCIYFWCVSCFGFSPQSCYFIYMHTDDDDASILYLGKTWIFFSFLCFSTIDRL